MWIFSWWCQEICLKWTKFTRGSRGTVSQPNPYSNLYCFRNSTGDVSTRKKKRMTPLKWVLLTPVPDCCQYQTCSEFSHSEETPQKLIFLIKWISAWLPTLSHKAWPSLEGQCADFYVSRHQLISHPSLTTLARMTAGSPSSALTKRQKLGSPSHHAETTLTWGRGEGEGVLTGVHDACALCKATRWIWGSLTGWRGVQNPVKITIMIFF